jgi:anti-anti-sigma factor
MSRFLPTRGIAMTDVPDKTPIKIEKRDATVIAQPQMKTINENELALLGRLVDQATGANSGITLVILDLSHIQSLPSLGLGLLVQMSNKCKVRQQKLKLAGLQPTVRQVLAVTRLDRMFDICASVEAALE